MPISIIQTPVRLRSLIAVAALVAAAAGGCANKRRTAFEMPPDSTPEARAAQLDLAEKRARDAERLELTGETDAAINMYVSAIEAYNELPVAWHNLGVLYAKKGLNREAAEAYKTASELSPTDPRPLYNLGALWEELGYLNDAARWYDEALQRDPNYLPALRRSILVDDLRASLSQTTAERLKAAIILEREPWWINRFKRIQGRMTERDYDAASGRQLSSPVANP